MFSFYWSKNGTGALETSVSSINDILSTVFPFSHLFLALMKSWIHEVGDSLIAPSSYDSGDVQIQLYVG